MTSPESLVHRAEDLLPLVEARKTSFSGGLKGNFLLAGCQSLPDVVGEIVDGNAERVKTFSSEVGVAPPVMRTVFDVSFIELPLAKRASHRLAP